MGLLSPAHPTPIRPTAARSFVHLHVHTEYSMLDGASRVNEVVAAAAADGQPGIGIT
ncbi:MAG: PHP domain-containing protein, partial [Acidimicrobiia bacterium]